MVMLMLMLRLLFLSKKMSKTILALKASHTCENLHIIKMDADDDLTGDSGSWI